MTGFGRTGEMFAVNHYHVVPDIIVEGKALRSYCPVTAVIFREKVSRIFDKNLFSQGQSYSGHALACATALRTIEVLKEENLIWHSQELGGYLGQRLTEISKRR